MMLYDMIHNLHETAKEKDTGFVTQSRLTNDLQMLPQEDHHVLQAALGHPAMKMPDG